MVHDWPLTTHHVALEIKGTITKQNFDVGAFKKKNISQEILKKRITEKLFNVPAE